MKFRLLPQSQILYRILFICAVFVLLLVANLSYKQINNLNDKGKLVMHSLEVRNSLDQVVSLMKDAETGQRGFIITSDTTFLQPYNQAHLHIDKAFRRLRALNEPGAEYKNDLDSLEALINKRLTLLNYSLVLRKAVESTSKNTALRLNMLDGKKTMDEIRNLADKIVAYQEKILAANEEAHRHEVMITPMFSLLVVLFSLFVFILSYYKINNNARDLAKLNSKLQVNQKIFEHAEEIAGMSHWEWNLKTNKLQYSINQYNLLGSEPKEFETPGDFIQYVHPDDHEIIRKGAQRVYKKHEGSTAFFRVIRTDGELRYFKSIGKTIKDDLGNDILIGVNVDITEEQIKSFQMEEKNHELERRNEELASFNYIASHDLQEPLRKIQVFISRIFDAESGNNPELNKEYLARIKVSADRMQSLIEYLLMYSRTNKENKAFELTDINLIMENARQELALAIEEKKAIINSSKLPIVKVIPQQIQQLFINLIGNSLKYSRPGIPPEIKIEYKVVSSSEIPNWYRKGEPSPYYKISIMDNGIGFDQEYAQSIFLLFKRLHEYSEFSGTGIGLAICKKIVENHDGAITAEGKSGVGARFDVYLPA